MPKSEKRKPLLTPMFRVSFPDIRERSVIDGVRGKYRLVMMFDKGADLSELQAAAKKARLKKWPKALPNKFKNPFKKVDNMDDEDVYDGMEPDMVVLSASSQHRPGVVDAKRNPINIEELDTYLYGGMYARAAVSAFPYDTAGNRGVAFGVDAIQIIKDGEPLGSRINAEEAFADVEDDEYVDDTASDDGFDL